MRSLPVLLAAFAASAAIAAGSQVYYRIAVGDEAPAYRLGLPASLYSATAGGNWRNLQVFNATGEPVPTQFDQPVGNWVSQRHSLPFYPLPASQTAASSTAMPGGGLVVDGSRLPSAQWASLELELADAAYRGRVRWWLGDDLQHWREGGETGLLKLASGPAQTRIDLAGASGRYLRIDWLDQPFTLNAAHAITMQAEVPAVEWQWSSWVAGRATAQAGDYEFDLAVKAPLERLEVRLPQNNTLVAARWLARNDASAPWQLVWQQPLVRVGSAPVVVSGFAAAPQHYWLLQVDTAQGGLGRGVPEVRAGWQARQLIFMARGSPPFRLGYLSGRADGGDAELATLLSDRRVPVGSAMLGEPFLLNEPASVAAVAGASRPDSRRFWLWGSLLFAVALLGAMAWRLLRETPPAVESVNGDPDKD
ncbi:DUF3999 family protein [Chitinilyticum piscinae]|uniref:DUF3999 family protein n=1 Tax=Chitinilyticum piscinae TaxID=2866724 RepID=A0A8J7KED0_9NEIS|nr:DUF3999 family protein [Chitinilyticum piscinae]MBE9609369.1 DUF3999 family protein [Chitinilyticum piscinae]